ncbi:arrestin domain protein, partial [Teladorsagia circumcincta]
TSRTESYTETYSSTVMYAEGISVAWLAPKGSKEVLNAGSYQFPFTFQLPINCAPSFEVVPVFNLNTIPEAAMPIKESTVKNLGIVLFKHGKVSVQSEIPKTGFVPGETIVVNAYVINDSSKDIIKATIKLVEISKYVAFRHGSTLVPGFFITTQYMDNSRELRRKIATGEQDICVQKKGRGNVQLYLQVPPTVPTFNCCPIVSVEYMVEVKFKTQASFKGDVISHCHIIVGTIPVGNPYVAPQPSAPPPDVPLPSSSGPSAPPLETPPPYPVLNGASVDPPPPPSYEEAVQGVGGTTMDTDDMEPFVPRYPFYPQLKGSEKANIDIDGEESTITLGYYRVRRCTPYSRCVTISWITVLNRGPLATDHNSGDGQMGIWVDGVGDVQTK